jgi:outer membrane protein
MRRIGLRLLVTGAWLASGAIARAETLNDALSKVYTANPRIQGGRAALRAADEAVPLARAAGRPQLAGNASAAYNAAGDALPASRQSVSLSQTLYDGGSTRAATEQAENAARAEQARLMLLEQQVLLDAIVAFTTVARDTRILELARGNEERLRIEVDATRDREHFGDLTRTDILQAETRHAASVADRIAAEGELAVVSADYVRIVGEPPDEPLMPPVPPGLPASLDEGLAQSDETWQRQVAGFELAAAEQQVAVALAAMKPRLSLGGEVSYVQDGGRDYGSGGGAAIGATLSVPLYQGGGDHARVRQSKELFTQRRYGQDDARRASESEITAAWEAGRTAEAQIDSIRRQIRTAALAVDGVREEAQVGARSVVDLLDAERERFAAEVELAKVEQDRVVAAYRLLAAVGRLTARDLGLAVAYDDPKLHFESTSRRWLGLGVAGEADERP